MGKERSTPLYYQIVSDIKEQIIRGELKIGEKIPSEKWMSEHYDVSRVTVRRAMDELVDEGFLEHVHNKGKYVKNIGSDHGINSLHSVHKQLEEMGIESTSQILSFQNIEANKALAQQFKCKVGELLMQIERLRFAGEQPYTLSMVYIKSALMPQDFNPWGMTERSLHEMFEKDYGLKLGFQNEKMMAAVSNARHTELLKLPYEGYPLILMRSQLLLKDGEIVKYAVGHTVTDVLPFTYTREY